MGIEMKLLLISEKSFSDICSLSWSELYDSMSKQQLRDLRPESDEVLSHIFSIDAEVELLDWMDEISLEENEKSLPVLDAISKSFDSGNIGMELACDGILKLLEWCCIGYWDVWEGRAFLYFELLLDHPVEHVDELYSTHVWDNVLKKLPKMTENEYTEGVILDWMKRRDELGETLDENFDPRILSTHQSHTNLTKKLYYAIEKLNGNSDLSMLLGREHLASQQWRYGVQKLRDILLMKK